MGKSKAGTGSETSPEKTDLSAGAPDKAGIILATLIMVAAVANLPLAMANVALPAIGQAFDASQPQLNLVAVAYSLGLACSVLWLGALGDRYGRKLMAMLGVALAIPAAQYPQYAEQITAAAKAAFLDGDQYAYIAGIVAVLIVAALVFFMFPKQEEERKMLAAYNVEDMAAMATTEAAPPRPSPSAGQGSPR